MGDAAWDEACEPGAVVQPCAEPAGMAASSPRPSAPWRSVRGREFIEGSSCRGEGVDGVRDALLGLLLAGEDLLLRERLRLRFLRQAFSRAASTQMWPRGSTSVHFQGAVSVAAIRLWLRG
ncbi:hypothetical protein GCM10010260_40510 [Streptomyces filipinensis]|uniref:Uncharacterized protein n=1 Tax=Streptomyces filipinensis TaxID=66887 RepID=A0A918IC40_9ACTN|nr:hypothetical protein GCM10010260_40510 [Streptomyces filipinensis]